MESFTTTDIAKILGIKRERTKNWLAERYIYPSIQKGEGTGTKHLFSRTDLYLMGLFEYLLARGFSRTDASERLKKVYKACEAEFELLSDQMVAMQRWNFIVFRRSLNGNGADMVFHYITMDDERSMNAPLSSILTDDCEDLVAINFGKIRRGINKAINLGE